MARASVIRLSGGKPGGGLKRRSNPPADSANAGEFSRNFMRIAMSPGER